MVNIGNSISMPMAGAHFSVRKRPIPLENSSPPPDDSPATLPRPELLPVYFGGIFKQISQTASKVFQNVVVNPVKQAAQAIGGAVQSWFGSGLPVMTTVKIEARCNVNANPSATASYASGQYSSVQAYQQSAHYQTTQVAQQLVRVASRDATVGMPQVVDAQTAQQALARIQKLHRDNAWGYQDRIFKQAASGLSDLAGTLEAMEQGSAATVSQLPDPEKDKLENLALTLYRNQSLDSRLTQIGARLGRNVLGFSNTTLEHAQQIPRDEIKRYEEVRAEEAAENKVILPVVTSEEVAAVTKKIAAESQTNSDSISNKKQEKYLNRQEELKIAESRLHEILANPQASYEDKKNAQRYYEACQADKKYTDTFKEVADTFVGIASGIGGIAVGTLIVIANPHIAFLVGSGIFFAGEVVGKFTTEWIAEKMYKYKRSKRNR